MRISTKGRYGLRAMIELSAYKGDGPLLMSAIAENQKISRKYLHALLTSLRSAGLVRSVRGAQGGYILAKPPEQINVFEILEALEGPLALTDCVQDPLTCDRSTTCAVRELWVELSAAMRERLEALSLSDLRDRQLEALDCLLDGQIDED